MNLNNYNCSKIFIRFWEPAEFILKVYVSLQARYKMHIINNNITTKSIKKCAKDEENLFVIDQWSKITAKTDKEKRKTSKFFCHAESHQIDVMVNYKCI